MSDYLYDGEGPVDDEVVRLERALSPYRRRPPAHRPVLLGAMALAAAALLGLAWWSTRGPVPWSTETASCSGCLWTEGSPLDTSTAATAALDHRGELQARPGTRLERLARDDGALLRLRSGEIDVRLAAPPRWLIVQLPGVDLVDLGCAYTARVDDEGHGQVAVHTGWVALEGQPFTTTLPAGTLAATWPDGHTGLPVAAGASPALIAAVDDLDRRLGDHRAILAAAVRPADALTVWHLLPRVDPSDRPAVLGHLEGLVPGDLPPGDLLNLDEEALRTSLAYIVAATL